MGLEMLTAQLASEFGIAFDTMRKVVGPLVPCRRRKGRPLYRLRDVIAAYVERERHKDVNYQPLTNARTALANERARIAELERKILEGSLLPADQVSEAWNEIGSVVRIRVLGIATKLAAVLAAARTPGECQKIVDGEARTILEELSRHGADGCDGLRQHQRRRRNGGVDAGVD